MRIRRLAVLGVIVGGAVIAGCGGSSFNPRSSASYRLGVHLDTLAVQAANAGLFDRYRLLSYPIAALMENLAPSSVTMSVDGSSKTYKAAVLELVGMTTGSTPTPSDSLFVIVTWADSNADELVYTQVALPDTLEDVADLTDTVANPLFDSATVLSVALSGATKPCRTFSLPLPNAAVSDFLTGTKCTAGTATAAFSFFFTPGAANPHGSFVLASQQIAAIRLVLPADNGGQERLRGPRARRFRLVR